MSQSKPSLLRQITSLLAGAALLSLSSGAFAQLSDEAAKKILKKNDCFKCHAEDKTKKGPSYKKIAEKYKGKADAMEKLNHNLTDSPKVKLEDGTEEEHKVLKTDAPQEKTDLMKWILAR